MIVMDNPPGPETPGGYAYQRSTDGGVTWHPSNVDDMAIKVDGQRITGTFCAQQALASDGSYFMAYAEDLLSPTSPQEIRFLRAVDDDSISGSPRLTFAKLPGEPVITTKRASVSPYCPNCYCSGVKTVPWIAMDPTDSNRFFVVYSDTVTSSSTDVNIYCVAVTRASAGANWTAGERVKVNKDINPFGTEADQFLPSFTVDTSGVLHVTFYDDRNYSQTEGSPPCGATEPPFNLGAL